MVVGRQVGLVPVVVQVPEHQHGHQVGGRQRGGTERRWGARSRPGCCSGSSPPAVGWPGGRRGRAVRASSAWSSSCSRRRDTSDLGRGTAGVDQLRPVSRPAGADQGGDRVGDVPDVDVHAGQHGTVNLRSCGRSANHISLIRHTRPGESRRRTGENRPRTAQVDSALKIAINQRIALIAAWNGPHSLVICVRVFMEADHVLRAVRPVGRDGQYVGIRYQHGRERSRRGRSCPSPLALRIRPGAFRPR